MTSRIDNNIDELIRNIMNKTEFSGFMFYPSYPPREVPTPIEKYTVAVEDAAVTTSQGFIGDAVAENKRGSVIRAKVRLRVYAPQRTSGEALLRASSVLADAVAKAECSGAVGNVELKQIKHDLAVRTSYRDIEFDYDCILLEEARHD